MPRDEDPSLVPGSPSRLPLTSQDPVLDKALSVIGIEAAAHSAYAADRVQGAIESSNQGAVAQPGSVRSGSPAQATARARWPHFASSLLCG